MSDQHVPDASLVGPAVAGDRAAFSVLLERHGSSLLALCRRLLGPGPEAEDAAQEAALAAWLAINRLREPDRFGAWLLAIGANLARMALRRRRMLSLEALAEPAGMVALWNALPGPEEVAAARELHDTVIAALAELSPLSREAVIGFYLQGYSQSELATILGVPVGTLKGRLVFGRKRLRERLHDLAGEHVPRRSPQLRKEPVMSEPALVQLQIDSVRMNLQSMHRVVVLREEGADRYLPIWIGPFEADMIQSGLEGVQYPRPMTHDLSLRMLEPLGATISRVRISRITDNTFFSEIVLRAGDKEHCIDARPSDALALAVRAGVPIYAAPAVLEAAAVPEVTNTGPLQPGAQPEPIRLMLLGNAELRLDQHLQEMIHLMLGEVAVIDSLSDEAEIVQVLQAAPDTVVIVNLGPDEDLAQVARLQGEIDHFSPLVVAYAHDALRAEAARLALRYYLEKPVSADVFIAAMRAAVIEAHRRAA
ncbi:MAG: sigma-70 family RNA polymerase sigma factor [Oscillochloris sp.]|nr:sigma-70 family RNA polymerase sigma factor [Oscillochloris sp.]